MPLKSRRSLFVHLAALPAILAMCGTPPAGAQPQGERVRLRGHVTSLAGQPVVGVVVIVRRRLETKSAAFWGGAAQTDARGDFVLEDAEEGDYEIGGESLGLFRAPEAFVPYRLTRTSPPAQVTLPARIRISLQVLGPDGQRVAGQQLLLAARHKAEDGVTHWRFDSQPAPTQALSLMLNPGSGLFVSCFALGWGFVDCGPMPEGSSQALALTLRKGGSLRLQAVEEGSGRPIAGAVSNIRVPEPSDFAQAQAQAPASEVGSGMPGDIAILFHFEARQRGMATGLDGAFTIQNLRPGFYNVDLTRPGFEEPKPQLVRIEEGQATTCTITLKPAAPITAPAAAPTK